MKNILLLISILGLTNCSVRQTKLSDNETVIKTFEQTEIDDLQLLFDFFNESICSETEKENLNACYSNFFDRMEESVETGNMELKIDFENQKKIYDQFSDSTFQEIWTYGMSWNYQDPAQDTFKTVSINLNGKYLNFLKRVGKNDKLISNYYETVEATGDISPSLVADLLVNHDYYNIEDIRIKLIVAIHYLTLNDRYRRKEKINKNSG